MNENRMKGFTSAVNDDAKARQQVHYLKNLQMIQNRIRKERSLDSQESITKQEMSPNMQTLPEIRAGK